MVITVHDVDKFAPVFDKMSYFVEMEEERLYDSLLKIEAHDGDESEEFSKICGYELQNDNVPFVIDNEGKFCVRIDEALFRLNRAILSG